MGSDRLNFKWAIFINGKLACECTDADKPLYESAYRQRFPRAKIEAKSALGERIRRLKEKKEKEAEEDVSS